MEASLFTPFRIKKGPGSGTRLLSRRVTRGVTVEGEKFEIEDDWRDPACSHRTLGCAWSGRTFFFEDGGNGKDGAVSHGGVQVKKSGGHVGELDGAKVLEPEGHGNELGDWHHLLGGFGQRRERWADL